MPLIPALVTLAIALYQIQRPSLWRDEGATLAAVHRSLPQLLRMLGPTPTSCTAPTTCSCGSRPRRPGRACWRCQVPVRHGRMAVAAGFLAALGRRLVSTRAGLAAGRRRRRSPSAALPRPERAELRAGDGAGHDRDSPPARAPASSPGRRWRWLTGYGVSVAVMGLGNIFALLLIPAHGLTLALWARHNPATGDGSAAMAADGSAPAPAGGAPAGPGWPAVRGWPAGAAGRPRPRPRWWWPARWC